MTIISKRRKYKAYTRLQFVLCDFRNNFLENCVYYLLIWENIDTLNCFPFMNGIFLWFAAKFFDRGVKLANYVNDRTLWRKPALREDSYISVKLVNLSKRSWTSAEKISRRMSTSPLLSPELHFEERTFFW